MFTGAKWPLTTFALVWLTLALSQAGVTQQVLYDNFRANNLDPAKWAAQGPDSFVLEAVRKLDGEEEDRHLHLSEMAYGPITDDSGTVGGSFGLLFTNPSAITAVSFELAVNKVTLVGCKTNSNALDITAGEFRGSFFNIYQSPVDGTGDVQANISIGQSTQDNALTVFTFVSVGFGGPVLGFHEFGNVAAGSKNTLFVEWDQPHHRFGFRLNDGVEVFEPYNVPDTTPAFFPFKWLALARVIPDCTATPRPSASIDANFGNVHVNP